MMHDKWCYLTLKNELAHNVQDTTPQSAVLLSQSARLLRPVDELFVESLKLAMKANPSTDAALIVGLVVLGDSKSAV